MLQELRLFLSAIQFFTRLPVPAWVGHDPQRLAQAARYLPSVGALIGALCAIALLASARALPLPVAVLLSMVAGLLITGAFHEDGLSDFADGLGGGFTREKALAIMKDSSIGAYGAISLILVLLLKYQSLLALCETNLLLGSAALIASHAASRLMAASIMATHDYVREDDSARAKPAAQRPGAASGAIALATGIAALLPLYATGASATQLAGAIAAAVAMRTYLAWRLTRRLGGYTGDCLGAVQQLTEVSFYLGLLVHLQ